MILTAAPGNPAVIAGPVRWAAGLMLREVPAFNAGFATIQLLISIGLFGRPRHVRIALAASVAWAAAVWWLGEGLGGLLAGTADPFTGAPGAAIIYVLLAAAAWPGRARRADEPAAAGRARLTADKVLWVALWAALASTALQPAVLAPGGLAATLNGSQAGEPAWIGAMDRVLVGAVAGLGTQAAIVLAALCTVAAMAVAHLRLARLGVAAAALAGTLIWVAEDFGGILTGQATDPNTGLLLIVAAVAFWPLPPAPPTAARAGPRRP